ncbi:AMP-binding protein [Caenimonas koreensis]|uniref:AMP-binding protein n=1 Tax=Caenimonas koreensis DSM 17982 TaxID=1121255 RepID=A0A844AX68_9BURK|nr:AMP-binding protein [Caenimonas koreensis]MRD49130.1 AMP-binding protein [Caenimonas koreensis DSM 17982]
MSAPGAGGEFFRGLADIEALEAGTPYEQAIPARTTYGLIERAAKLFGQRIAFTYLPDGEPGTAPHRITYGEVLAHVNRAANLFRSLGVGPGDSVAILAPNIPATHYALWGAQVAGRACPINFMLQPDHIAALLEASGAKVVVALGPHHELDVWHALQRVPGLQSRRVLHIDAGGTASEDSFDALIAAQPSALTFDPQLTPDRIAALFHTGGTTGAPKLVQHTHGNEAHTSWFAHRFYGFDEHTVEVNGFPLFHVAGAFVYGLAMLAIGASQVLPTVTGMRNAVFMRHYWKFCEREKVTALACVPTILAGLCNVPIDADISTVRVAYTGGSPLPGELASRFETATGIAVRNILGMTECAGLVAIEPYASPRVPGSAGLRMPYSEVRVVRWRHDALDFDDMCAAGETGVIVLRGPHMSPGYTDARRNAGMFEQGWIVSGDLGHLDGSGGIHVTGRAKDVIIRGSHNIDPGLVEEAFLAHPAVAMCAVVAEPDAHAGEVPVAFVTLKPGAAVSAEAVLKSVGPHVYERPATPRRVVVLDALPLTAVGKIFKPALRLQAIEIKLEELLAAVCEGRSVAVSAAEEGGVAVARVVIAGPGDDALAVRCRNSLGAIAVRVEISFTA